MGDDGDGIVKEAGELAEQAGDAIVDGAEAAGELAGQAADAIGDAAGELAEQAGDAIVDAAEAAGELAEQAGDAILDAAEVAGELAEQAADAIGDAAETIVGAVSDVDVGAIAATVGDSMEDAVEIVSDGIDMIGEEISDAFNSENARELMKGGFGAMQEAYTMSAAEAKGAIRVAAGLAGDGCASIQAFLRLEVIRDFGQIVGTAFSSLYKGVVGAMKATVAFFGFIFTVITLNIGAALRSEAAAIVGLVIAILLALCAAGAYIWMICFSGILKAAYATSDELRGGKEVKSFREQAREMKENLWYIEKIIALCLAIYLPIGTYACQIIFCDENSYIVSWALVKDEVLTCKASKTLGLLSYFSWFIFIVFLLPLPIFLGICVNETKPRGNVENPDKIFNADGIEVDFDDKVYNDIVENDVTQQLNPFRTLYQGFECKFALYKVGMLVWKLFLVAPTIALSGAAGSSQTPAAVFQLVVLIVQAAGFYYMMPFVDDNTDFMDSSGRITACVVALGGIFAQAAAGTQGAVGSIVMIANIINGCIMAYFTAMGFESVQLKIKNWTGRFTFHDTTRNISNLGAIDALKAWDTSKEIKHRVWQSFWNGILLKHCGEEVPERLLRLQKDTIDNGLASIEHHWEGERDPQVAEARMTLRRDMEGIDMYWDGKETLDGHLDSVTFFGKLIVQSYPFNIRLAYDDSDDVTFLKEDEKLLAFIKKNRSPKIEAKRAVRKNLRVMSDCKTPCNWPFTRWETHTVEDGYDITTTRDPDGNTHTHKKTHYSQVSVEMFYTTGYITVAQTEGIHSRGFDLHMQYHDGHGSAIKPRTGERFELHNEHAAMPPSHFDCDHTFEMTKGLQRVFSFGREDIERNLGPKLEAEQEYRSQTIEKEKAENAILSDGFWYFVYNDYKLSRKALDAYLHNQETNPTLQNLNKDHAAGLDYVYKKLAIIALSPANEAWYVFWEDFYHENNKMDILVEKLDLFDPKKARSICYRPMKREDLKALLEKHGLFTESGDFCHQYLPIFSKQYFNDQILDALYDKMEGREVGAAAE